MTKTVFRLLLAIFVVVFGSVRSHGQAPKVLSGVVSGSSLTLEHADRAIVFGVDSSTRVIGKGRARDLLYRWPERRTVADFVKAGDRVTVTYHQSGAKMKAVEVRVVSRK